MHGGSRCAYSRAVEEGGGEGGGLFFSWIRPHVFLEIIILKNSVQDYNKLSVYVKKYMPQNRPGLASILK